MKKMKTERESFGHFLIVFILCLNAMCHYLHTRIKYKSIAVFIKDKIGEGTLHFKYVLKE